MVGNVRLGCSQGLERGLIVEGATGRRSRTPGVVSRSRRTAVSTTDLVDLRRRVAQRGADLVHLELHDRALLALFGLEAALPQPASHHDATPAGQGLRDVLRYLAPDVA